MEIQRSRTTDPAPARCGRGDQEKARTQARGEGGRGRERAAGDTASRRFRRYWRYDGDGDARRRRRSRDRAIGTTAPGEDTGATRRPGDPAIPAAAADRRRRDTTRSIEQMPANGGNWNPNYPLRKDLACAPEPNGAAMKWHWAIARREGVKTVAASSDERGAEPQTLCHAGKREKTIQIFLDDGQNWKNTKVVASYFSPESTWVEKRFARMESWRNPMKSTPTWLMYLHMDPGMTAWRSNCGQDLLGSVRPSLSPRFQPEAGQSNCC